MFAGDASINSLIVQNIIHPGLSEVYNELLTGSDGNSIYVRGGESIAGLSLAELASERPNVVVLGLLRPVGKGWDVRLIVPSATRIEANDRVIMMAREYSETEPNAKWPSLPPIDRLQPRVAVRSGAGLEKRVLVLGWNRRVPGLVAEFGSYSHQSYSLDLVSVVPAAERSLAISRYVGNQSTVNCHHVEADYMVEGELRRLDPSSYDSVILLSSDRLASGEEADARAMVGYLQLEDILMEKARRPHLILELSDPDNRPLLYEHRSEMLISPMILSHILAQVALRRELRVVLDELFTVGGAEIQFRDPGDYPLPGSVDFHLLERILADEGEIALGVFRQQADAQGRHLHLNPPRREYLDLQPGDRLVVLSLTD